MTLHVEQTSSTAWHWHVATTRVVVPYNYAMTSPGSLTSLFGQFFVGHSASQFLGRLFHRLDAAVYPHLCNYCITHHDHCSHFVICTPSLANSPFTTPAGRTDHSSEYFPPSITPSHWNNNSIRKIIHCIHQIQVQVWWSKVLVWIGDGYKYVSFSTFEAKGFFLSFTIYLL